MAYMGCSCRFTSKSSPSWTTSMMGFWMAMSMLKKSMMSRRNWKKKGAGAARVRRERRSGREDRDMVEVVRRGADWGRWRWLLSTGWHIQDVTRRGVTAAWTGPSTMAARGLQVLGELLVHSALGLVQQLVPTSQ